MRALPRTRDFSAGTWQKLLTDNKPECNPLGSRDLVLGSTNLAASLFVHGIFQIDLLMANKRLHWGEIR